MLTTIDLLLFFVVAPLGACLLIAVAVYLVEQRNDSRRAARAQRLAETTRPFVGASKRSTSCWVQSVDGREVHLERPPSTGETRRLDHVCWVLRCTDCGRAYREGGAAVHFTGPDQASASARAAGWEPGRTGSKCPQCATR